MHRARIVKHLESLPQPTTNYRTHGVSIERALAALKMDSEAKDRIMRFLKRDLVVSRARIFSLVEEANRGDTDLGLTFRTIMLWGYTMDDGRVDSRWLSRLPPLFRRDLPLKAARDALTGNNIVQAMSCFVDGSRPSFEGLGISFISKVLYFFGYCTSCTPKPLIFDQRVARQLVWGACSAHEVLDFVTVDRKPLDSCEYSRYCAFLADCAAKLRIEPDCAEYLLYSAPRA